MINLLKKFLGGGIVVIGLSSFIFTQAIASDYSYRVYNSSLLSQSIGSIAPFARTPRTHRPPAGGGGVPPLPDCSTMRNEASCRALDRCFVVTTSFGSCKKHGYSLLGTKLVEALCSNFDHDPSACTGGHIWLTYGYSCAFMIDQVFARCKNYSIN